RAEEETSRKDFSVCLWLSWNLLCRQGWPRTHRNLQTSRAKPNIDFISFLCGWIPHFPSTVNLRGCLIFHVSRAKLQRLSDKPRRQEDSQGREAAKTQTDQLPERNKTDPSCEAEVWTRVIWKGRTPSYLLSSLQAVHRCWGGA
ncbi:hypothetical protein LEMLEM_LOCUS16457, partial [Lemmus lemmus]